MCVTDSSIALITWRCGTISDTFQLSYAAPMVPDVSVIPLHSLYATNLTDGIAHGIRVLALVFIGLSIFRSWLFVFLLSRHGEILLDPKRITQAGLAQERNHAQGAPVNEETLAPEVDDQTDGSDVMDEVIRSFLDRKDGKGEPEISTGIKAIDHAIIGLRPKKTYIIAARPGMGKTTLADSIRRAVVLQGYVVAEFSLEMGQEEIGERELAYMARINLRKVMAAKEITEDEVRRVILSRGSVPRGLWWVYDKCFSIGDIVNQCRKAKRRAKKEGKKIGLIIIDYLQLMGDEGTEGRQQSVSTCSRKAKLLSKEMDCAVLVLSQLNRMCEMREDKRPMLSDLRESGSIEQDADVVAFIYRGHLYDESLPAEDTELIIRKQRSGPTGTVRIRFNPRTVHFDDVPPPPAAGTSVATPDSDGVVQ